MIESRAAVARAVGAPLQIETVTFDEPLERELLVKVEAAALCHSDLHTIKKGPMLHLPMIIGHEAAGVVEAVGSAVNGYAPGDKVIFSFIPSCGHCHFCTRGLTLWCDRGFSLEGLPLEGGFRAKGRDGEEIAQMQRLGLFSERTVVHQDSVMKIPADTDMKAASLLSCGFTTGAGAVLNAAQTQVGDSVAVLGAGGVGTSAIQGAAIAGASQIIAIDVQDHKLVSARRFGATDTINAKQENWVEEVRRITGGYGADRVISSVTANTAEGMQELVDATAKGGIAVLVGTVAGLTSIDVAPGALMWSGKTLTTSVFGGPAPQRDQVRFLDLYRAGRLQLDEMVTQTYTLDQINDGFEDLAAGKNVRGVIEFA